MFAKQMRIAGFDVGGNLDDYFTVTFPRDLRAEDVEILPQASINGIDWGVGPVDLVFVNEVPFDGTRTLVTYRATTPLADHDRVLVRLLVQGR